MSWRRAGKGEFCGYDRAALSEGAPVRVFLSGVLRCAACAKRLVGEDPPVDIPETRDVITPQPSLPIAETFVSKHAGFVSAGELARVNRGRYWRDKERLPTGDRE